MKGKVFYFTNSETGDKYAAQIKIKWGRVIDLKLVRIIPDKFVDGTWTPPEMVTVPVHDVFAGGISFRFRLTFQLQKLKNFLRNLLQRQ